MTDLKNNSWKRMVNSAEKLPEQIQIIQSSFGDHLLTLLRERGGILSFAEIQTYLISINPEQGQRGHSPNLENRNTVKSALLGLGLVAESINGTVYYALNSGVINSFRSVLEAEKKEKAVKLRLENISFAFNSVLNVWSFPSPQYYKTPDIFNMADLSNTMGSKVLKILVENGLLLVGKDGKATTYFLSREVAQEEVDKMAESYRQKYDKEK
jgi:predicted transcriptional regulator/predicted transcriptional regulator with HTH domain